MSLSSQVSALYQALLASDNSRRVGSQPAAGLVGTVVTLGKAAYGAFATIVAVSTITNPSWAWGLTFDSGAEDIDVATVTRSYDFELATGTAGSEVPLVEVAFGFTHTKLTAVGEWTTIYPFIALLQKISGQPRLSGRGATSNCAATTTMGMKVKLATAVGT